MRNYLSCAPRGSADTSVRLTSLVAALRLSIAKQEIEYGLGEGAFDEVVVNSDLDEASESLARIVEGFYGSAVSLEEG